jgi:hypothetical protein
MFLAGDLTQFETVALCYALGFMTIRPLAIPETIIHDLAAYRRAPRPLTGHAPSMAIR